MRIFKALSLLLLCLPTAFAITITSSTLPNAILGVYYSYQVTVSGATGSGRFFSGCAGFTGSSSQNLWITGSTGLIYGTFTVPGTYTSSCFVQDYGDYSTDTKTLTITVVAPAPTITTTTLPNGLTGSSYNAGLTASGGTPPYTWSVLSGSLPPGVFLSGSTLTGTPSSAGTYNFTVQVTDSAARTATQALTITVGAALSITTASLPAGATGASYWQALSATGGTPPYSWSQTSGSLPPGLSVATSGTVSGTPAAGGDYSFTIQVTDSTTPTPQVASQMYSVHINSLPALVMDQPVTNATIFGNYAFSGWAYSQDTTINRVELRLDGTPLANATYGAARPDVCGVGVHPGCPNVGWTYTFPATSYSVGSHTFRATAYDNNGLVAYIDRTFTIVTTLTVTTSSLPGGLVGSAYSQSLAAANGTPGYSWSITTGSLPPGLTLSGNAITGTPSATGTYNFTVQATDSGSPIAQTATKSLSITTTATLAVSTASLPNGLASSPYPQSLSASGGIPGYTWSLLSGSLPTGLLINTSGTIYGTSTTAGTFNFTVQVADSTSQTASKAFSITIGAALSVTTASLLNGLATTAYSQSLTAAGGTPGYTWAVASGALPTGLSLSAAGVISGTPSAAGTYSFTVQATDSTTPTAQTATKALSITITAALSITTASLPNGLATTTYSQSLTASGGTPGYTWSLQSGSLPTGLSLAGSTISGTPTAAGTYNFTIRVTDSTAPTAQTATKALTITIGGALSISTATLPNALAGSAYSQALAATGGTSAYSWSLISGALPAGLTLTATGTIYGTPTAAGSFGFTVRATDSTSPTAQTATRALALTVGPALSITTTSLPAGLATTPYSQSLSATGGTPGYSWALASGTLPTGLTLTAAGTISGTPSTAGAYAFSVRATDSTTPTAQTATQALTINISVAVVITTTILPSGVAGTAYSQPLAAAGGTPTYSWSIATGALPTGLALSAGGAISGTPTAAGTYNFTARVTDSTSPTAQTATQALTITVGAALSITTTSLSAGLANTSYSQTLVAAGGTIPYTWSIQTGTLPAGLLLNSSDTIYGTPTTAGTYNFTVKVTDNTNPTAQTVTKALSITVGAALTITTSSLPSAIATTAYSRTLTASGGTPGYSWTLSSGALPTGLSLSAAGAISGTPTTAGTFSFTVQATDSTTPTAQTATKALSITITPSLAITTASLPNGLATTAYSQTLAATGGTTGYTWALASGTLPTGVTLSAAGTVSGTPTTAGTYNFTVRVTDSTTPTALTATKALSISIGAALTISTASLPVALAGTTYSQTLAATGGTPPYTFSLATGTLPAGLILSPSGSIYGTPTTAGSYSFTLKATDSTTPTAQTATASLSITVNPALSITTTSLPNGLASTAYSQTLSATGGTSPYIWAIASGALPTGLALGGNTIAGTPIAAGTFSFVVKATDSTSPTPETATQALTITIGPALSITSTSLATGVVSKAYSQTLTATGGTSPYTWSVVSGSLPTGLSLAGNTISGTPTAAGTFSFNVRVTDSTSPAAQTATVSASIVISAAFAITTASPLPTGLAGTPYSTAITANGGTAPYTFTLASGAAPAGLTLQSNGTLSGTPTVAGTSLFSVLATDSTTPTAQTQIKPLAITINPQLEITTAELPNALVNTAYAQTLSATGGTPAYVWTVSSGALPAGLALTSGGVISGTPTAAGTYTFTVRVTDTTSPTPQTATQSYTVQTTGALAITTSSLPAAVFGASYNTPLAATGGTGPYRWTLIAGSLPSGLSLTLAGYISGTCTSSGAYTITVQVTDSTTPAAQTATRVLTMDSNSALSITTATLPDPLANQPYTTSLSAAGGVPPYAWSIAAGSLPTGLSLSAEGAISGTAGASGLTTFSVRVTDTASNTTTKSFNVTVQAPLVITTTTLAGATSGTAYSASLAATGGTFPYSWTLLTGQLPTGLALSSSGLISGTPTLAGTATFSVQVADTTNPTPQTATQSFTLSVADPLVITTTTLPYAISGTPYTQPLTASGGTTPYAWSISSGSLPAGLVLNSAGIVSGTPSTPGTATFTVHALDSDSPKQSAYQSLTLTVLGPLTITTPAIPQPTLGQTFSASLTATGGQTPYAWSITSGSLPDGLTLSTSGGISGIPTTAGPATCTIEVTDSASPGAQTATRSFSVTVVAPLTITTTTLPMATLATPYSLTVAATGGTSPYAWSLASGALPAGLTLNASTGEISGTPSTAETATFTVQAADNGAPQQMATQSFTLRVASSLSITSATVPSGLLNQGYSAALAVTGGLPPYTWSLSSGALPPGLTLAADGTLAGAPTEIGAYTFTAQVSDSLLPTSQTATRLFTLNVLAPLQINTLSLPSAIATVPYTTSLNATGGTAPYTWSLSSGNVPASLTLRADGTITGTPTAAGTSTFVVQVGDAATPKQTTTQQLILTVVTPLSVTTATLPPTLEAQPYSVNLAATGGVTPYTWSVSSGAMPAGLTLAADGTLSGIPSATGSNTFTVQVTDNTSPTPQVATRTFTTDVLSVLTITTLALPSATTAIAYNQPLAAAGGTGPYAWSIASGTLPAGLTLDPSTGEISGAPTTAGVATFTARVTDLSNPQQTATRPLTLTVVAPLTITTTALPVALTNTPYAHSLAATGGIAPYTWSLLSGSLPAGLTLDGATGTISGTPTTTGSASLTIRVTDAALQGTQTATKTLDLNVVSALTVSTATLSNALQDVSYAQSLGAIGGTPPYAWSLASGTLPAGLTLTADGNLSGTPTAAGTFPFTVQVTDSTSPTPQTATKALALTVNPPLSITTTTLPNPKQSVPYNQTLAATGGTQPYTWSLSSGSLPAGLTLAPDGAISGTPTTGGSSTFTVNVVDASAPTPQMATATFVLNTTVTFQITTETLPAGIVDVAYATTLAATGGTTPYTWRVTAGTLPPGLNLSFSGTLAGTPLTAGTYSFDVTVNDAAAPTHTAITTYTVAIQPTLLIVTTGFPDGSLGTVYTQSLAAIGGVAPYTWALVSGTLPQGLHLDSNGTISGIAVSSAGTAFTVRVTDNSLPTPQTATREFGLTIAVDLAIATASLPDGFVNLPYSAQLSADGGSAPYTWNVDPASLPPGLSMTNTGAISGTPTASGVYALLVNVRDSATPPHNTSRTLALAIHAGLSITTDQLPDGQLNVAYSAPLAATNGSQPYTWTVSTGSLPPGLALLPAGTITGTPTAPGGYNFSLTVTDSSAPALSATKAFAITVGTGFTITTTSLPAGTPDVPYSATLLASGGTTPYAWTLASGTLPPGLSLSSNGTISGIPSATGTYSVTIQAADAATPQLTATRLFSIAIGTALSINTPSLEGARLGTFYRQTLRAINGTPPYLWTLADGALPPGLILLATGDIVAQPTAVGSFTFTVSVTDSALPSAVASQTFTINVVPGFAITTPALPNASPGVPYTVTLDAVQGTTPYTWSIALGSLPKGLTLNANTGRISGTPAVPGLFPLIIQATDSSTPTQTTARQFTLNVDTALSITTALLPDAQTGQPYYQALSATNGLLPYTWSLASAVPPGITLLPSGELYGVPTIPGQYKITVTVADSSQPAARASRDLLLLVTRALTITTDTVPNGLVSQPYATVITAAGGTPPYRFSFSGSLPRGLTLSSTGVVTGTPTTSGQYRVTITVRDGSGDSAERDIIITVGSLLTITTANLPSGITNSPYFAYIKFSGGTPPYSWTVNPASLPPGLTFLPSVGVILGSPTTAGKYPIQIVLNDSTQTTSASYTISIAKPLAITTTQLAPAQQSLPYSQTLTASGGQLPYTWSVTAGSLPAGLTLNAAGIIIGTTKDDTGAYPLPLCVTDAAGSRVCETRTLVVGPAFQIDRVSIPAIRRGQTLTYALTATGAQGNVSWLSAFPLPTGLALSSTGVLSGAPAVTGTYTITIIATDDLNQTAVADFTLLVTPPLTIQTTVLPAATVGAQFAAGLQASSGTAPYSWSLASGALPPDFHLDPAGIVYGFPTQAGSSTFTVTVLDSSSPPQAANAQLILTIDNTLVITTTALPNAVVASPYRATLDANGVPPLQWVLLSGSLPDGLTLAADGTISGTPTASGAFSFVASTTDAHGQTAAAAFALAVGPALAMPPTESTLPQGTVGTLYNYQLHTTFTTPVTWVLVLGTFPPGIDLSPSGLLDGTPTAPGTRTFMLQASAGDQTATQIYTLTIVTPTLPPITVPSIPAASTHLAAAAVASPYAAQLTATGGATPYRWSIASGDLPPGLVLAPAGVLSGTPTEAGIYQFALTVTDANGQTATASSAVIIRAGLAITGDTTLTAHVGTPMSFTFTAAGGAPPYTWSTDAKLPAGLNFSTAGIISGTPAVAGTYSATITVRDANSTPNVATTLLLLRITESPTITTANLPNGIQSAPYTAPLAATGGTTPYSWTIADGALPPGLTLSAGSISGQPAVPGTYRFSLAVTDATGQSATAAFLIRVAEALTINAPTSAVAQMRKSYTLPLTAQGGTPPYSWAISAGTLPAGLTLSSGGTISGTPTVTGNFTATATVTDSGKPQASASAVIQFQVLNALTITTAALPPASRNSNYTVSLEVTGGDAPYNWFLSDGALPAGLTLAGNTISGVPSGSGTYPLSLTVSDANSQTTTAKYTLTVYETLTITSAAAFQVTTRRPSLFTLTAAGGFPPYTWSVSSGQLPPGLSLNASTGQISGTATAAGSTSVTLTVRDAARPPAAAAIVFQVNVTDPLTITSTTLPATAKNAPYSASLQASGGTPPYTWTVSDGQLPSGLLISDATLSGVPTDSGTFRFSLTVTDAAAQTSTTLYTLTVADGLVITTPGPFAATTRRAATFALAAAGGTPPYTWSITAGQLPTGLSLGSSTGHISGTPSSQGSSTLTVTVRDSARPQVSAAAVFQIVVTDPLTITTASLPNAATGASYSATVQASGGTPPYTWSISDGQLPPGLTLAGNILSGLPSGSGSFRFSLTVTDAAAQTATTLYTLTVADGLVITTPGPFAATTRRAATFGLAAAGGTPPYTWSITAGQLPSGLSLGSSTGHISGTPSSQGSSTFTVTVRDSARPQVSAAAVLQIVVTDPLTITTTSLPNAATGAPYSGTLQASGGTPPYTWTVTDGQLPTALTLAGNILSGLPSGSGTFRFSLTVTDAAAQTATTLYTLTVADGLVITTPGPFAATARRATTFILAAAGGTPPYAWSITAGQLPSGLSLGSSTGQISGTPSSQGSSAFTVTVRDSARPQVSAAAVLQIAVTDALTIATASLPNAATNAPYSATLQASGGTAPYTWTVTDGQLPSGLTLAGNILSGSPTTNGQYTFTTVVTDTANQTAARAFIITVSDALTVLTPGPLAAVARKPASFSLTAAGGMPPYTWTLTSGKLPAGLSLRSQGTISGTPTTAGSTSITVTVRDSASTRASASAVLDVTVTDALAVTTVSLPTAPRGTPYSATLQATGGTPPYTWTIADGQPPAGIILTGNTLNGTPTTPGTARFTVTVTDAQNQTASAPLSLLVSDTLTITTTGPVVAFLRRPVSVSLGAVGGIPPYSWSVSSGSLPAGLTLSSNGTLSGTPSATTTTTIAVAVRDAGTATASAVLEVHVTDTITITTTTLPSPSRNTPYSATLSAAGGTPPYKWAVSDGILPPDLTLNSTAGTITGTPTTAGSWQFTITLTDAVAQTATASYAVAVTDALTISTVGPLVAAVGKPATFVLTASGGTPPYTWSVAAGTLPAGLSFTAAGTLTGIPTLATAASVTFSVRDSAQPPITASATLEIRTNGAFSVATSFLPDGFQNSPYNYSLQAVGGKAPYTWTLTDGQLPPGVALSMDGLIAGTPSAQGTYRFTVSAADSAGQTASAVLTCTITPLTITTTTLAPAKPGSAYLATLDARGGLPPYRWSSTPLPDGLLCNADGVLSGTPARSFSGSVTFTVTDASGATASVTLPLTITTATAGRLRIAGLSSDQVSPATQLPLAIFLEQAAPIELTGVLTLQFAPSRVGRDDTAVIFLPANARIVSFTVAKGATAARFDPAPLLQTGTTAGTLTLTAQLTNADAPVATLSTRILPAAPVITGARVSFKDKYTLDIEVLGYSTTTDVLNATFAFTTRGQSPPDTTLDVKQLFSSWYLSQSPADQAGTFRYNQRLNFSGGTDSLSGLSITLTNSVGAGTPYQVPLN